MNICLNGVSKKIINILDKLHLNIKSTNSFKQLYTLFSKEYKKINPIDFIQKTKSIKLTNQLPNILRFLKIKNNINLENKKLKILINKHIRNKTLPKKILDKIIDINLYSEFSSYDILLSVDKINKVTIIKYKNINLTIYYTNSIKKTYIISILKRCIILSLIHNINTEINIKLWLINAKKKSSNNLILGAKEINSGMTVISLLHRETTILREEEHKKLIIHELIHYLDLDFKIKLNFKFSDYFNISPNTEILLYESYTETSACIINSILFSYECQNRKNYSLFKKFIVYETKFALFQIAKILILFGFKDVYDFVKPYDNINRFKQTTAVFSYYFIKGALLFNSEKMMKFYNNNCDIIKFKKNKLSYNTYIKLVMTCCLDKEFLSNINYLMSIIKNDKKLKLFNSMRMTCIEI